MLYSYINNVLSNNKDVLKWKHNWPDLIGEAFNSETRVIEYITYYDKGHVGWHTDNDSIFTVGKRFPSKLCIFFPTEHCLSYNVSSLLA